MFTKTPGQDSMDRANKGSVYGAGGVGSVQPPLQPRTAGETGQVVGRGWIGGGVFLRLRFQSPPRKGTWCWSCPPVFVTSPGHVLDLFWEITPPTPTPQTHKLHDILVGE